MDKTLGLFVGGADNLMFKSMNCLGSHLSCTRTKFLTLGKLLYFSEPNCSHLSMGSYKD